MAIQGVKVNIFLYVHSVVGFYSGSEWGWCLNNGTLIIINH
jgi:hypothetical protein